MHEPQEQPATKTAPAKQGWRVRWSLRAFLGMITLACMLFGWITYRFQLGKVHQDAGERLATLIAEQQEHPWNVGRIDVRWTLDMVQKVPDVGSNTPYYRPPSPNQTREVVTDNTPLWMKWTDTELAFQRIREIRIARIDRGELLDDTLEQIQRLEYLDSLEFEQVHLASPVLSDLLTNVELRSLKISDTRCIFGDIPGLRESSLKRLTFSRVCFTNLGLDCLPESLVYLDLEGTSITDDGLEKLPRLKNLSYLNLANTRTSEAAVNELRRQMDWCEIAWGQRIRR
ncbi:hypothetical protein [Blastopirellula marina]|uniref:Leucine-rich repeat domain-containing protein n=1 Tax=Blastopirellula marina TaxID=124 RepID=A0A2S8GK19_9BACT|nr:hypothetical protein [Blastopirellula marina]PQO44787.1 hypothetical protein C5Y93_16955 [Blastopirellula marina]